MTMLTKQEIEALAARLEGPTMTAAKDLIAAYFGDKSKCLASIPADPSRDADLLVTADIKAAATLARTALDAMARLEDAEAAQALVVERAAEAAYEADSLEISLHGANGIAERIRAFAQASGVAALAALRAERDEWKRLAVAGELTARNLAIVQAERDALRARLAAVEERVAEWHDGSRPLPFDRDTVGRMVREAWVRWAETQPSPKPSWLAPYDELNEADKEADRQIGEAVARWTLVFDAARAALATVTPPADTGVGMA